MEEEVEWRWSSLFLSARFFGSEEQRVFVFPKPVSIVMKNHNKDRPRKNAVIDIDKRQIKILVGHDNPNDSRPQ